MSSKNTVTVAYNNGPSTAILSTEYETTQINLIGLTTTAITIEVYPPGGSASDFITLSTTSGQNIVKIEDFSVEGIRFTGTGTGTILIHQR